MHTLTIATPDEMLLFIKVRNLLHCYVKVKVKVNMDLYSASSCETVGIVTVYWSICQNWHSCH